MTHIHRRGLTLIEVLIVIAILAIAASIIYPNLFRERQAPSAPSEDALVEQARSLAIARAEPMRLTVDREGVWAITSDADPASQPVASGRLAEAPAQPLVLRVTELGACIPGEAGRQVEGPLFDAVSCSKRP